MSKWFVKFEKTTVIDSNEKSMDFFLTTRHQLSPTLLKITKKKGSVMKLGRTLANHVCGSTVRCPQLKNAWTCVVE